MSTTNRATNIHTIKTKGKNLSTNIYGTYQKIFKCRIIAQSNEKYE